MLKKMPLNIRILWNAGTACVSECVLKTLACRGWCVGPSKRITCFPESVLMFQKSTQQRTATSAAKCGQMIPSPSGNAHESFHKSFHYVPSGLTDFFRHPATHFARKAHPGGVCAGVWHSHVGRLLGSN